MSIEGSPPQFPHAPTGLHAVLYALIGGVLTTLTVAPFNLWPLAFPGIGLLYLTLVGTHPFSRFARTLMWGVGLYVPSLWWITEFSIPGSIIVGLLEASITALVVAALVRSRTALTTFLTLVSALMFADALRSLWPLGGLPLGGIDLGQASGPVAAVVTLGGRLLLVGVVAAGGSAIGMGIVMRQWHRPISIAIGVFTVVSASRFAFSITADRVPPSDDKLVSIALIQGGGPRGLLASTANAQRTWEAHLAATEKLIQAVDIIIWPENTVDVDQFAGSDKEAVLAGIARKRNAWISVGITEDARNGTAFTNAQIMMNPEGRVVDRFDKVRRVPYGEYFPLRSTIEGLGLAELPNRDAVAGRGPGVLRTDNATLAVAISYEGFFDDRSRVGIQAGGDFLIIPTNSSSYTTSQLPEQQIAAARLRALETRRTVLQVGPTGISAEIDPNGRIVSRGPIGNQHLTLTTVQRRTALTPYVRFNDLPALVLAALGIAAGHLLLLTRSRQTGNPAIRSGSSARRRRS